VQREGEHEGGGGIVTEGGKMIICEITPNIKK